MVNPTADRLLDPDGVLDHLVYGVLDLDEAVANIERHIGLEAIEGGRHLGRGSRNYLFGLSETSYVEVIGLDQDNPPDPGRTVPFQLDRLDRDRVVAFAIHPESLPGALEVCRGHGVQLEDPLPMSRLTPEGQELRWELAAAEVLPLDGLAPFLIDWGQTPHPASARLPRATLEALEVTHPEAARLNKLYAELGLGISAVEGPAGMRATLRGPTGTIRL